ncbi:glycosyltransferase family 2 protein [Coraliomargarita sp. W4R53]
MKQLVLIPSYNTGPRLQGTVMAALAVWEDVWVVVDGSDDGSERCLQALGQTHPNFRLIVKADNGGKGAAVLYASEQALEAGFTHALVMDADGQHPADSIWPMMQLSQQDAQTVVMGQPVFGADVPKARLYGRRLTIFWTELETLYAGLGDTLFGMRVYPLRELCEVMQSTSFARGYDFDPEVAVRLVWRGVRPVPLPVPVRYFTSAEGGVSHFHYLRDNVKLTLLHFRLMILFLLFGAYRTVRCKKAWNRQVGSSSQL